MLRSLRKLFSAKSENGAAAAVPEGERVYAIGDIHGRIDLLEAIMAAIDDDDRNRGTACTSVIMLGDLVDRGPDSRGVIALARRWKQSRNVRILCGNHEEMFLHGFTDRDTLRHFLRHGGRETLFSYGVDPDQLTLATLEEAQELMAAAVPAEDRAFMETFEDMIVAGDYLFVHAGIAPGVPMAEQRPSHLRWIREPFLSYEGSHGAMVVHGHTITDSPEERPNRIGIDTGAYATGVLTALVLEGTERNYLTVRREGNGPVVVEATG